MTTDARVSQAWQDFRDAENRAEAVSRDYEQGLLRVEQR